MTAAIAGRGRRSEMRGLTRTHLRVPDDKLTQRREGAESCFIATVARIFISRVESVYIGVHPWIPVFPLHPLRAIALRPPRLAPCALRAYIQGMDDALTPWQRAFSRKIVFWAVFAGALAADLASKAWAESVIFPTEPHVTPVIPGFLGWKWAVNEGAAFSILHGYPLLLVAIAAVVLTAIFTYAYKAEPKRWVFLIALSLVAAGAIGNLYDRLLLGHVRDFIFFDFDLPLAGTHLGFGIHVPLRWPVFNVADMAILGGVAVLVVMSFIPDKKAKTEAPADGP
jgi:signal peptidase II